MNRASKRLQGSVRNTQVLISQFMTELQAAAETSRSIPPDLFDDCAFGAGTTRQTAVPPEPGPKVEPKPVADPEVKKVQETLNRLVNANVKVDGIWGNKTKNAAIEFLKGQPNPPPDLDRATKARLLQLMKQHEPVADPEVKKVQETLNRLDNANLTADGIWDDKTKNAAIEFLKDELRSDAPPDLDQASKARLLELLKEPLDL